MNCERCVRLKLNLRLHNFRSLNSDEKSSNIKNDKIQIEWNHY